MTGRSLWVMTGSHTEVKITRYRKVVTKKKELYHLVFNLTPFYAESGGQIGDRGIIENDREKMEIIDTRKENELIIHVVKKLPSDPSAAFTARVDQGRRIRTANNHTATHLMHHALREVLGDTCGTKRLPGGTRLPAL